MLQDKNWSDWWRQFFGLSPAGYREIVKILQDRYIEEMQHVKRYAQHAEKMQYPQFRERLLRIAAEEARHGEWLAEKITLLGSHLPPVPQVLSTEKNSWRYLLADLEEENHCGAALIEKMQSVRNELPDIAEGLERIYEEGEKHRAELREMIMRSDPQSNGPG
ncbi:MAG: ferritin-like domain-containing protein [Deltaproteobacteria bacterium]|nr:ferritin-like domain-containing protein [Deltaproteobacteria bacterium]